MLAAALEAANPAVAVTAPGPTVLEARRERALQAAVDAVRFPLTRLVRSVADRLTTQPTSVGLATLEVRPQWGNPWCGT